MQLHLQLRYEVSAPGADFVFNIHAAHTACQRVSAEMLQINQPVAWHLETEPHSGNRYLRLHATEGPLVVQYGAVVALTHLHLDAKDLPERPVGELPSVVLPYMRPSRYCESDRLARFAQREFGRLPAGAGRVQTIARWVQNHISFRSRSSVGSTSAVDTLISREGVCRDFAHLMIALCRALNMPARFTTGTDYGADPALGPPDFHAYVEIFLGRHWCIFDPSGTSIPDGLVRLGTGRDAADVAFATMFGPVIPKRPEVSGIAIVGGATAAAMPLETILSTDGPISS